MKPDRFERIMLSGQKEIQMPSTQKNLNIGVRVTIRGGGVMVAPGLWGYSHGAAEAVLS
jgi:hypothetical protein